MRIDKLYIHKTDNTYIYTSFYIIHKDLIKLYSHVCIVLNQ